MELVEGREAAAREIAWETAGKTGVSKEAVDLIAMIYAAEAKLRSKLESKAVDTEQFKTLRALRMAPIFAELRSCLMTKASAVAP